MTSKFQNWFRENSVRFSGPLLFDEPLSKHTYYRIGGPATVLAFPRSIDDVHFLAEGIRKTNTPYFILGQGSNVLVADSGYQGLIIRASRMNIGIEVLDLNPETSALQLRTGGSVAVSTLLRRAAVEGWAGLEFLTGIPGSVGGVVAMNAGTHLGEAQSRIRKVEAYPLLEVPTTPVVSEASKSETSEEGGTSSPALLTFQGKELQFQYRRNLFLPPGSLIWSANWELRKESPTVVQESIQQILVRRKSTQPIDYPSCGSVFKNPKLSGRLAWEVIDELGLRGYQVGKAKYSEKHSNFIVNLGEATAENVYTLIQIAKSRAEKELGVPLEEEVIYLPDHRPQQTLGHSGNV